MGSLLAFPLGSPLGGVAVSDVRVQSLGGNIFLVEWTAFATVYDDAFVVAVDGRAWAVTEETSIYILDGIQLMILVDLHQYQLL